MPDAATLLLLATLGGGLPAERPAEIVRLPEPAGLGRLLMPPAGGAPPLVILLPDALGEDGRAEPYAESLSARGIASLALGLGEDRDHPATGPDDPASRPEAVPAALAWAEAAGFDPARLALLGFGAGGRAALAGAEAVPVVALYPGCRGLGFAPLAQALVLHGAEAPDAEACRRLSPPGGVELRALPGLGHGWDVPGAIWPEPGSKVPDPAGGPRILARMDLGGTLAVAEMVADHLEAAFGSLQAASR